MAVWLGEDADKQAENPEKGWIEHGGWLFEDQQHSVSVGYTGHLALPMPRKDKRKVSSNI